MTLTTSTNYANATQRSSTLAAMGDTPQDAGGADAGSAALLPAPAACGLCDGSIAELSMLLTKADEQDRTASRQLETIADQAATREANDRVAQMQAKASADESQGLAAGVAGIAGGALSVMGAFVSMPSAPDGAGAWRQILSGVAGAAPKVGDLVASQYKGIADRADVDASRSDAQSQADIRRYNQAHEDAQAADQSMQKVEQFLDQVQQTENASRLTAATYRG
jgi:hypothetical protein